jgi:hypothetical protein
VALATSFDCVEQIGPVHPPDSWTIATAPKRPANVSQTIFSARSASLWSLPAGPLLYETVIRPPAGKPLPVSTFTLAF